jgi:hypothetical protein
MLEKDEFGTSPPPRRAGVSEKAFASMLNLIDADGTGLDNARRLAERSANESDL